MALTKIPGTPVRALLIHDGTLGKPRSANPLSHEGRVPPSFADIE